MRLAFVASVAVTLALVLVLGVLGSRISVEVRESEDAVDHTRRVLEAINEVRVLLLDCTGAARAYALWGHEDELPAVEDAKARAPERLGGFGELTRDNPAQQARMDLLRPLVAQRLDVADELVRTRKTAGGEGALRLASGPRGPELQRRIDAILDEADAEERRLLNERRDVAAAAIRRMETVRVAGMSTAVAVLAGVFALAWRAETRRAAGEARIRENEARMQALLDAAPLGISIRDLAGRFLLVNHAYCKSLGRPAAEVLGRTLSELWSPEIGEAARRYDLAAVERRSAVEFETPVTAAGVTRVWHSIHTPIHDGQGNPAAVASIATDVTERRRLEQERERTFTDSLELLCVADLDGRFRRVNPSFIRVLGWSADELTGKPFIEFVHPDDREATLAEVKRLAAGESVVSFENRYAAKGGGWRWLSWRTPAPAPGSTALYASARDVTEERAMREEVRRLDEENRRRMAELAAANKELEAFAYSVSHDLRAPLRAIAGFSQVLQEDFAATLPAEALDSLRRIVAATRKMGDLIEAILQLSRVTRAPLRRETMDLGALALAVMSDLRRQAPERKVDFAVADDLEASADPALVRVLLVNLLGNAWKYTGRHPQARIELGRRTVEGKAEFFVRDDGAGFDPQYADRIFTAFQRLHAASEFEGTGIGLATAERVVRRHGGTIRAEGAVEKGATFYFTLE